MRRDMGAVVGRVQGTCPRVEQLHGRSTRVALRFEEAPRDTREPAGEAVPRVRIGVHHGASAQVLLRRAALDEVRGERERRPGEADKRRLAQFCGDDAHSIRNGGGVQALRVDRGDAVDIGAGAHRVGEDRAAARLDHDIDAGQPQRDDDVAEEHRRIHPVPTHRLQRDLGGEIRGETGIQHPRADAQLAVFGE